MKPEPVARLLPLLGWLSLAAGLSMLAYALCAAIRGVVYIASRSTEAWIYFEKSPLAFSLSLSLYLLGGALLLWIAWGLLPRSGRPR